jgi:hypothetical protein
MVDEVVVAERIASIASALRERSAEFAVDLIRVYEQEIPQLLRDDERMISLLASSVQQNIETAMEVFQHGIEPTRVEAPLAAIEYARRLAQRGTPVVELIRAYHVGQTAVLDHALAEATRMVSDPQLLGAMVRSVFNVTYSVIDRVTQQVVSAYGEERDRWLANQSAVRAARVRVLLSDDNADVDASEAALGYRLRRTHLGMVAWHAENSSSGSALAELEALAGTLATGAGKPLFVPCDESNAWVWLPVPDATVAGEQFAQRARAASERGVRIAFGEPAHGVTGFRRTHRQALQVQALGEAAGPHAERVMAFGQVGSLALMASDLESAKAWVRDTLGRLAVDDETHSRLRETLLVFLSTGGSYTAAAARLGMHKNSVQYRVRKAEEALVRPVADNRLEVELALTLCRWLGSAVL